jgi:outer membrane receptor for ferrienterochelin and colicins
VSPLNKSEKITNAPANVFVISGEELKDRGYRSLADLWKDLPGTTSFNFEPSEEPTLIIRGHIKNNRMKIMLNGMELNHKTGTHSYWGSYRWPIEAIKYVEFVLGPYASLYGRNSFSGVLNIVLKDAVDIGGTDLSYAYGTTYRTHQLQLVQGKQGENWGFLNSLYVNDSHGRELGKNYPEVYSFESRNARSQDLGSGSLSATAPNVWKMPHRTYDLYSKVSHKKSNLTADISLNKVDMPNIGLDHEPFIYFSSKDTNNEEMALNARLKHLYEKNKVRLDSSYVFQFYDMKLINGYAGSGNLKIIRDKGRSHLLENRLRLDLWNNYNILMGANYEKLTEYQVIQSANTAAPTLPTWAPNEINDYDIFNLTFQNEFKFFANKVKVVAGAMYEINSGYDEVLVPRFSFLYNPYEKTAIKLLYGGGYLAPDPSHKVDQPASTVATSIKANPDIKPEYLSSYELNILQGIAKKLDLNFSLFYNKVRNIITVVDTTAFSNFGQTRENIGKRSTFGAELGATYRPTHNLSFDFKYGHVDGAEEEFDSAKVVTETKFLRGIVKDHFTTNIKYNFGKIKTNLEYLYYGKVRAFDDAKGAGAQARTNRTLSSFDVVNLTLRTTEKFLKNSDFSLSVYNLFDVKAFQAPIENLSFVGDAPIPRRSLRLGFRRSF